MTDDELLDAWIILRRMCFGWSFFKVDTDPSLLVDYKGVRKEMDKRPAFDTKPLVYKPNPFKDWK